MTRIIAAARKNSGLHFPVISNNHTAVLRRVRKSAPASAGWSSYFVYTVAAYALEPILSSRPVQAFAVAIRLFGNTQGPMKNDQNLHHPQDRHSSLAIALLLGMLRCESPTMRRVAFVWRRSPRQEHEDRRTQRQVSNEWSRKTGQFCTGIAGESSGRTGITRRSC